MHWLESLPLRGRLRVIGVLRRWRDRADALAEKTRWYNTWPKGATSFLPAGSEGTRTFCESEGIIAYNRGIWNGYDPNSAQVEGTVVMREIIDKWNARREYQVHIATDHGHTILLPLTIALTAIETELKGNRPFQYASIFAERT